MSETRYGDDFDGPRGCPEPMYPWDVDYEGEVVGTLEEFKSRCYHDSLNLPISWYFSPEGFELVWVMPRKNGKTWSLRLAPGFDRAEVEQWLEDWTHKVAAAHYGWTAPASGVTPPREEQG